MNRGVRLAGQVVDADTGAPLAGATVTTDDYVIKEGIFERQLRLEQAAAALTGQDGRFEMWANFPNNWTGAVSVNVSRPGYESSLAVKQYPYWLRSLTNDVLSVYPTLTIAANEQMETRVFLSNYSCGWEGWTCRRVAVEAEPGELLDIEVTALDDSIGWGIVIGDPPLTGTAPPTRITTGKGEVWILPGAPAELKPRVRIATRRH